MIKFDAEVINDLVSTYLYEDIEGRDSKIYSDVEYYWEKIQEIFSDYRNGEVSRVLNSFQLCEDNEDERENKKAVRGVKSEDVAFIASHYGFIFGLVWAENRRLGFWKG